MSFEFPPAPTQKVIGEPLVKIKLLYTTQAPPPPPRHGPTLSAAYPPPPPPIHITKLLLVKSFGTVQVPALPPVGRI